MKYIGVKLVEAFPQTRDEFAASKGNEMSSAPNEDGYRVKYADGYESWCPKEQFEKANLLIGEDGTKITAPTVDSFLKNFNTTKLGSKTTVVQAELANGFIITDSSSCVDPVNYDDKLGTEICLSRIKNKIWELLGFLLQTATNGVK
ncbi:MAG: Gp49 family protein [Candidatus Micrarchaeia archaeon]|jgi:hypothetical protein